MSEPYVCQDEDAGKIHGCLLHRGGIFIWRSVNLSNPGASWTSPARDSDGKPITKPNWQCGDVPQRHIENLAEVMVSTAKEVKRFHVATRMGGNGMSIKVTDGGTRKIRAEIAKARQRTGKTAWYRFDYYDYENCKIFIDDTTVPLSDWVAKSKEAACTS